MINLSNKEKELICDGRLNLRNLNESLDKNKEEFEVFLKRISENTTVGFHRLKILNVISTYFLLLQDNKDIFEIYFNIVKEGEMLKIIGFRQYFNNLLKVKEYIKGNEFKEVVNNNDESILSYISKYKDKNLLFVCNLLGRENFFSFDCREGISPNILISNYENSEKEIDELRLRAYEVIIYEF